MEDGLRDFGLGEVRQVLLNPGVTGEVLGEIASSRPLMAENAIRGAVARHRRTPAVVAQRLIPTLLWRDLLEVSVDTRIVPSVRRTAEKYLLLRLPGLAAGERVAIARRSGSEVLREMSRDEDVRVLAALLDNPRTTEVLLVSLAADRQCSPRHLDVLSRHPKWGRRRPVRSALARNPGAPFRVLFDLLDELSPGDLRAVSENEGHAAIVRGRALAILEEKGVDGGDETPIVVPEDGGEGLEDLFGGPREPS